MKKGRIASFLFLGMGMFKGIDNELGDEIEFGLQTSVQYRSDIGVVQTDYRSHLPYSIVASFRYLCTTIMHHTYYFMK